MPSDIDIIQARQRQRRIDPSHACPDQPAIDDDIQFLIDELIAARATVQRLTEDDEDLRASCEIWSRLYEAALARASAAEAAMARRDAELPRHVQGLSEALDRVAELTNALGAVVRECTVCARGASATEALTQAATDACVRCMKALEALAPVQRPS
jgi:hypothetical protein